MLEGIINNAPNKTDNVLLEMEIALQQHRAGYAKILPFLVDPPDDNVLPLDAYMARFPDAPHADVETKHGINIKATLAAILSIQAVRVTADKAAYAAAEILRALGDAPPRGNTASLDVDTCMLCERRPRQVVFDPCRHGVVCAACFKEPLPLKRELTTDTGAPKLALKLNPNGGLAACPLCSTDVARFEVTSGEIKGPLVMAFGLNGASWECDVAS